MAKITLKKALTHSDSWLRKLVAAIVVNCCRPRRVLGSERFLHQ